MFSGDLNMKEIQKKRRDICICIAYSLEKSLMLGNVEGRRRRGHQGKRWPDGITDIIDMNLGKPWEMGRDREAWRATVHGIAKSQTRLGNGTTT